MLSCVWLIALRLAAGFVVWLSVIAANTLLLTCAAFCYSKSGLWGSGGSVGAVRWADLCYPFCNTAPWMDFG